MVLDPSPPPLLTQLDRFTYPRDMFKLMHICMYQDTDTQHFKYCVYVTTLKDDMLKLTQLDRFTCPRDMLMHIYMYMY